MKTRRLAFAMLPVLAAAAVLEGACTIVNGLSVPQEAGTPPPADAGGDVDPCNHAEPPEKNPTATGGGTIVITVVGKEFDFSPVDDAGVARPLGFDVDHTCTCPGVESCVPAKSRQPLCDGDEHGRDDAIRPMVDFAASPPYSYDISARTTQLAAEGSSGVLIQVSGYNGQADDSEVTVAGLRSPGLREVYPDGGTGPKQTPTWTAADHWATLPQEATDRSGTILPLKPTVGYVRDWTVVVRADFTLQIASGSPLVLTQGILTAHIAKLPDGTFTIDKGTMAARIPITDAIRALGSVEQPPSSGKYLCTTAALAPVFAALKKQACEAADVALDPKADGTGAPCNAMTAAFEYTAAPASLGLPTPDPPLDVCGDASLECPP